MSYELALTGMDLCVLWNLYGFHVQLYENCLCGECRLMLAWRFMQLLHCTDCSERPTSVAASIYT